MNKNRQNKGITLIALVITIVVLLILAGISINLVIGDNGIISKAQNASRATKESSARENVTRLLGSYRIQKYSTGLDLLTYLNGQKDKGEIDEVTYNNDGTIKIEVDGYEVIAKIDDLSIVSTDEVGGVKPQVSITIYQENGSPIVEGTTYSKIALTLKITNKSDLTSVDEVVLKNSSGTVVAKNSSLLGDSSADASYIVEQGGTYTLTVTGTKDGIQKLKTVKIRAGLKVGDYINYIPDTASPYTTLTERNTGTSDNSTSITQESLKWQVLKINDDGSMDLIGSATSQQIYFQGAVGYNNGVYIMNDICEKLYSKGSIKARSVNLEDFEYWLNKSTNGVNARNSCINGGYRYGTSKQYFGNYSYIPDIFGKTNNESDKYYTIPTSNTYSGGKTSDTIDITQTFYDIDINQTNYGEGYKALTNRNGTWIAARVLNCCPNYAGFGLRFSDSSVNSTIIFSSDGNNTNYDFYGLRPVVSLGTNAQITISSTASSSTGTPHLITQY